MATPYQDIFDLFMFGVQDYNLDDLYDLSPTDLETFLTGFLKTAIPKFRGCRSDLSLRDDTTKTFSIDLTENEQDILVNLMKVEWLRREVNDILQMQQKATDTDFKVYSEANNIKEKNNLLNSARETVEQQISNYQLDGMDWSKW